MLDVIGRSPLICGAGPDSERCGRQHGEALAALCLVIPRRDSTLLLLFGPASPNKLTAGFMARHHNAMLFIQSVISAHGSCQKPRQRIPSLGLAGMKHSGQMAGPTDGRRHFHTVSTVPRFTRRCLKLESFCFFGYLICLQDARVTSPHKTRRNISQTLVAFHGDERSELTQDHDI